MSVSGRLVLAATPLGNPKDASVRLREALAHSDVVAAEDTRRVRRLAADLEVTIGGRIVSYFEGNERARADELLGSMQDGAIVLVVTDAGMPSVSDPGYRLVAAAVEAGVAITVLPGPSAVTTALTLSGLPSDRFCFDGFAPRKAGERRRYFAQVSAEQRTIVLFEAPHRLAACLADAAAELGDDRRAAVCRELTKTYEEVRRGSLADLAQWAAAGVKGEITIVIAGATAAPTNATPAELAAQVATLEATGIPRKQALGEVAIHNNIPKRVVYNALLATKSQD